MKFDSNSFTYGVELEYGNCYRFSPLPDGAKWNNLDNTCVSSTGIANDPNGLLYKYGGEINTKPTGTVAEQVDHIYDINNYLAMDQPAIVNYRSNLHIHVRVPGLNQELESCKKLLRYIHTYQQEAFDIVEQIPKPDRKKYTQEQFEWAMKRYKRRGRSHQFKISDERVKAMLASTTVHDFHQNEAPLTEKGRMWFFTPRAGINLRQMWEETNTIEFRHFPGTMSMDQMESSIRWCKEFLEAALNSDEEDPITPKDIFYRSKWDFPKFGEYEFETEQLYQWTNFDANKKSDIEKRLTALRAHINIDDIDNVTSMDVYPIMLMLKGQGL